jgi:hypothetical protein
MALVFLKKIVTKISKFFFEFQPAGFPVLVKTGRFTPGFEIHATNQFQSGATVCQGD